MEPFAQVARPSGTSRPGVGLGLPLSRHLIELHGGSLALESTPGTGTTAVIRIPSERMISPA
jgi:signal transduction histidine kinase